MAARSTEIAPGPRAKHLDSTRFRPKRGLDGDGVPPKPPARVNDSYRNQNGGRGRMLVLARRSAGFFMPALCEGARACHSPLACLSPSAAL
jgi:hypothetical protein